MIPILGALFRSDSFQRNQSELVIIVTPYIVKPVNDPNALRLPTDGWRAPTDIERILYLRQSAPGYAGTTAPDTPHSGRCRLHGRVRKTETMTRKTVCLASRFDHSQLPHCWRAATPTDPLLRARHVAPDPSEPRQHHV